MAAAARLGGGVRIEVWDQGTGVPAEAEERIFDRFYRVDTGPRSGAGGAASGSRSPGRSSSCTAAPSGPSRGRPPAAASSSTCRADVPAGPHHTLGKDTHATALAWRQPPSSPPPTAPAGPTAPHPPASGPPGAGPARPGPAPATPAAAAAPPPLPDRAGPRGPPDTRGGPGWRCGFDLAIHGGPSSISLTGLAILVAITACTPAGRPRGTGLLLIGAEHCSRSCSPCGRAPG